MKKNILITGGSGFIGKNLHEYFQSIYTVYAPSHKELDLLDEESVRAYIVGKKIHIVIHAANIGGGRDTIGLRDVVQTNLRMFFHIVRNSTYVEKIISFGSGAEYDKSRPLISVKESDFDTYIPKDDYGFYKYVCSKYIEKADNIVCLRLFGVFGKYENYLFKFISNAIVKNLLHMPIIIKQNVYFDYLYIQDLLPIVHYFIDHDSHDKIYNIATGRKIDLVTLANMINKISDFQSKISVLHAGFQHEYTASNERLQKEIKNFRFTPPEESIAMLYTWYKEHIHTLDAAQIKSDPYIQRIHVVKEKQ